MKKVLTLSLVATLSTSGLALAHDGGRRGFGRMDANGDGRVTRQEMLTVKLSRFDEADLDKDGKLTPEERAKAFEAQARRRFTKRDTNGDGVLSPDEVGRMHVKHFAKLDADGSGTLSVQEMSKRGHGRGRGRSQGGKAEKGGAEGATENAHWRNATFKRVDVEGHVSKVFAKLDKNGDSVLTADEMGRGGCGGQRKHGGRGHGRRGAASTDRDAG